MNPRTAAVLAGMAGLMLAGCGDFGSGGIKRKSKWNPYKKRKVKKSKRRAKR